RRGHTVTDPNQRPCPEPSMSSTEPIVPTPVSPARMSVLERARRIFASPTTAWEGIAERGQAWIPLLFVTLFELALVGGTYNRVFVNDAMHRMEQSSETNPNMTPEVLEKIEAFQ